MQLTKAATPYDIAHQFRTEGKITGVGIFGTGHINRTFRVSVDGAPDFIIQRISPEAFHHPEQVMQNISGVTAHLKRKIIAAGGDPDRETLSLVPVLDGGECLFDAENACWRAYICVDDARSYDLPENEEIFTEAGRAFGSFASMLADYPADTLYETIPHFHDTVSRLEAFRAAVAADPAKRAAGVQQEIDFVLTRGVRASELLDQLAAGILPLRVTHNDTKLNNVLIDVPTGKGLCVVDLDTVMPGLTAYDFGDAIRFGANTALEDEQDLTRVHFSLPMYKAWCRGYLATAGDMSEAELRSLPVGCWMMTYEVGMRFLTDYLSGDVYFHTAYPTHNLVRARNQFTLLADMERNADEMLKALTE